MTKPILAALLAAATFAPGVTGAAPGRNSDQNKVYDDRRSGRIKSLREIEDRVLPRMGGADYLGPELDDDRYRLKFMQNGSVIWVDVDARTGQIIGRMGN